MRGLFWDERGLFLLAFGVRKRRFEQQRGARRRTLSVRGPPPSHSSLTDSHGPSNGPLNGPSCGPSQCHFHGPQSPSRRPLVRGRAPRKKGSCTPRPLEKGAFRTVFLRNLFKTFSRNLALLSVAPSTAPRWVVWALRLGLARPLQGPLHSPLWKCRKRPLWKCRRPSRGSEARLRGARARARSRDGVFGPGCSIGAAPSGCGSVERPNPSSRGRVRVRATARPTQRRGGQNTQTRKIRRAG
ncbi:hypothetical protein M885DRAFT_288532 [Pelagophyceae sp. CCMP2097]|nr:hypothetical protein M885DRAFT_288532 [Pelagophyceae sp. CCMP2097]